MGDTCPFHKYVTHTPDAEFYDYLEKSFCLCQFMCIEVDTGNPVSESTPATSPDTNSVTPGYSCQFPTCPAQFSRWQDRDRHLLTHLPHWIHCPLLDCQWRGNRPHIFRNHWKTKHSRRPGGTPVPNEFMIYDPKVFVDSINDGTISTHDAAVFALEMVHTKANQLQKSSLSTNQWGFASNRSRI